MTASHIGDAGLRRPFIVAVGGALRPNSSTEKALQAALAAAEAAGAETLLLAGPDLDLPMYAPERDVRSAAAERLVAAVRRADGLILGSPGYHGGISGLVKNALDYVEDTRGDGRCYFDGLPVGCVATGAGWQGAVTTLNALRSVVHALRGWNTPLGVAINTLQEGFAEDGEPSSPRTRDALEAMARQIVAFAGRAAAGASPAASEAVAVSV